MYLLIYLMDCVQDWNIFNSLEDMNKWIENVEKESENEGYYFKIYKKYKIEKEID